MYDKGKVVFGLAVFLILITFPIWFSAARGGLDEKVNPVHGVDPANGPDCVLPKEEMRVRHMEVLDDWRDSVVREGNRYIKLGERPVEMSLTRGCLGCHTSYEGFCKECHDYADVRPYCWDCHIVPKGGE
jgi:hypothetical protein